MKSNEGIQNEIEAIRENLKSNDDMIQNEAIQKEIEATRKEVMQKRS